MNVFGSPVTEATIERQPGYIPNTPITKYQMAMVATYMINDENKSDRARAYLNDLAAKYGNGVATKCLIYNATGETMTYVGKHDYEGHVGDSMPPMEIHNGQWGAFFYQKQIQSASEESASVGAVQYGLKTVNGIMSWWTSTADAEKNHCYADFCPTEHCVDWDDIHKKMKNVVTNQYTAEKLIGADCYQIVTVIGGTSVCEYSAVVKLLH